MAIDWSLFRFGKGKPLVVELDEKRATDATALRKAYDAVDKRDGKVCQVTGRALVANHPNPKLALERDHLDARSTNKGRRADPNNILTVSKYVHGYLQSGALLPVDKRGEVTTSVKAIVGYRWNTRVVKKAPFRIPADKAA